MIYEELVTYDEINKVWGNSDFGQRSKRSVILETLMNYAGGYATGHTSTRICFELGLLNKKSELTAKGRKYLFWAAEAQRKEELSLMHKYMLLQGCQLPEEMAELLRIEGELQKRFVEVGIVTLSKDF